MFGSKCYIKRDDDNFGKFDVRSDESYLVGYFSRSKAYKCYNMMLCRIVENIHVKFDEDSLCSLTTEDDSDEPEPIHTKLIVQEPARKDTKTPSKLVQRDHLEEQIIGDKKCRFADKKKDCNENIRISI